MEPISRRTALTMGGLGLVSTVTGGAGLWHRLHPSLMDPASGEPFSEPEEVRSQGGRLAVRLQAGLGTHEVAGRQARTLGYNGGVPGPTLRVRPGDTLTVDLTNDLTEATNLHVHGLHVSPEGNSDNIFLTVEPGATQRYEYQLPDDHSPGVYWYHPHHHGHVADQVFGGLYGAIIVEDPNEDFLVARERVMVISDITLDSSGALVTPPTTEQMMGREGDLLLVNGQAAPTLDGRAGDRERWRIVNACTSRYLALSLRGHDTHVIGRDQGLVNGAGALEDITLAPGNRIDLLVDVHADGGDLVAKPVDRGGMMGGMMGGGPLPGGTDPITVGRLQVRAGDESSRVAIPRVEVPRDLRDAEIDRRRLITFQMGMSGMMGGPGGPMSFTFDGLEFDADRVDQQVRPGSVEEWTIGNDGPLDHPFHLHVWPMQLVEVDSHDVPEPVWLDVVNVPARGQVKVRVAFEDFGGKTVYHCHILDHEDRGMMATVLAQ